MEGLLYDGYVFKYDLSIPIKEFYPIVTVMRERLGENAVRVCGYGHVGEYFLKWYCEGLEDEEFGEFTRCTGMKRGLFSIKTR